MYRNFSHGIHASTPSTYRIKLTTATIPDIPIYNVLYDELISLTVFNNFTLALSEIALCVIILYWSQQRLHDYLQFLPEAQLTSVISSLLVCIIHFSFELYWIELSFAFIFVWFIEIFARGHIIGQKQVFVKSKVVFLLWPWAKTSFA